MRGPRAAAETPSSAGSGSEPWSSASSGRAANGPLSVQPTQACPKRVPSPPEAAVGLQAFERYEAALGRLRGRDRRAIRGRIEEQMPYAALAEALGVESADAARAVVIHALGRLVKGMSG